MAFTVSNTFAGQTTLSAADLDQNFTDIENKLNGALVSSDLSAGAGITTGQLANNKYEFTINWVLHGTALNQAITADLIIGAVPYHGAAMTYTITGMAQIFMLDTGAAITTMIGAVEYGNSTDGWSAITNAITVGDSDNVAAITPTTATITTSATRPKFFRFNVSQAGVNYAAGDSFGLSILLEHVLRT